jgi:hypothetical protein
MNPFKKIVTTFSNAWILAAGALGSFMGAIIPYTNPRSRHFFM